ncbi:MAG TPA: DUF5753 domain-containing protein, partial [Streptosporangiaceae bacterium]|nr:DUF5753 domain-containing protein [Streptosporangiaceae bacterium]
MTYQAQIVPGLLQTPDYARAIAGTDPRYDSDSQRDRAVTAAAVRQEAVLGRAQQVSVVIGEAALRQVCGGPEVMAAQLTRLAELARDHPGITLQVLPFQAGAHAASGGGSFTVLRFPHLPSLGVVYLDAVPGGIWLDEAAGVAACTRAFTLLRAAALSPAGSAELLQRTAGELDAPWS